MFTQEISRFQPARSSKSKSSLLSILAGSLLTSFNSVDVKEGHQMKILFLYPRPTRYDSASVRLKPCGGTEKSTIFLGEAFQKLGHEVEWLTTPDEVRDGPKEYPDVVITQVAELLEQYPEAKKVFWAHHFSDQPVIYLNAAYARCFADKVVTLSECHASDFRTNLRIGSNTIGHGIWLDEVDTRPNGWKDPYRLIYASTPFRGLEKVPQLFRDIKAREPRATIAICSSMATYGIPEEDKDYQALFDELAGIEGVELLGALNQQDLYAEYARASIFFYPSIWPETYCLAMDEAMAHNCMPMTTTLGALNERSAYKVHDNPEAWGHALEMIFRQREQYGNTWRPEFTPKDWLDIAKTWEEQVLK